MKTTCPHCQSSVQVTQPQGVFACPQCGKNFTLGQPAAAVPPISFELSAKDMEWKPKQPATPELSVITRIAIVAFGVCAGLIMYDAVNGCWHAFLKTMERVGSKK